MVFLDVLLVLVGVVFEYRSLSPTADHAAVILWPPLRGWPGTDRPQCFTPHRIYDEKDTTLHSPNEIVSILRG